MTDCRDELFIETREILKSEMVSILLEEMVSSRQKEDGAFRSQ